MQKQNSLINETSPYLLQHAGNPVDWYPWGDEALKLAREQDKPILLSIGYSACHWCHVMAHESFEDPTTAELMNELFINIKVDREERPDLDKIYQRAHQMLSQRTGGWPLTVFLMPDDHMPFFAGTYFPKEARYQLPAFSDLLKRIAGFYRENHPQLEEQNRALQQAMDSTRPDKPSDDQLDPAPLDMARRQLENNMDWQRGGFGQAPKFPHPTNIERLMRHWADTQEDTRALQMACFTLIQMANGGINDQIGGGFCRYSVDDDWMIPHFEKMLYDNGPLLTLYCEAWAATQEPLFKQVMQTTSDWVMREMQSAEGGYYSSLDADTEGEEGKFYVWTTNEVQALLTDQEYQLFCKRYGLDREANFEGQYYPHVFTDWSALTEITDMPVEDCQQVIQQANKKLFNIREQRVRPGRDDKILTAWNGLMIKGMATAGRRLQDQGRIDSATRALDFIRNTLWQDGRLLATYKDGKAHLNAYLDDYAFLIDAILELLQARWRDGDLAFAIDLADVLLTQFEDTQLGGFYFTSHDHEQLIERLKPFGDDAIPSGNGIAAYSLQRLGHITGNMKYINAAERALKAAWEQIKQIPYAHNAMLLSLEEYLKPTQVIIMRGEQQELEKWQQACDTSYAPRRICLAIPDSATELPGLLAERNAVENAVCAYICNGTECLPSITDLNTLKGELTSTQVSASLHLQE